MQVAVSDLQHVHVALIVHGAQHVELHLMLTHLVSNQLRGGGGRLNEGGDQLLIGGGTSHDAAALNLLLQLHGLLDALIALLLGGALLILGAQVLGAIRFAGPGGCGGVVPHAGELIDGPLFALQCGGKAVNLRAVVPGALRIGVFRLHLIVHAAGFTNEVQDSCGNIVDCGVVALARVDEVASQFGGVLTVLEGNTRPDGSVPGKDARIIVEAVRKVACEAVRKVACDAVFKIARKVVFKNLCGNLREAQRALLSYRLACRLLYRLSGRCAGRVLYSIVSEGALRPRRDLLIQLIIRVLSIPTLLVLSH